MTFDSFLELKRKWLKKLHITWLIQGHLTEADAMKMVNVAETALDYEHIAKEDVNYARMVRINDRSIYGCEKSNLNAENPNSVCEAKFTHRFDTDKDD